MHIIRLMQIKILYLQRYRCKSFEPNPVNSPRQIDNAQLDLLLSEANIKLVELLAERGKNAITDLPASLSGDKEATAETIENNLRRVIIDESPTNPMYYEKMSALLDELI